MILAKISQLLRLAPDDKHLAMKEALTIVECKRDNETVELLVDVLERQQMLTRRRWRALQEQYELIRSDGTIDPTLKKRLRLVVINSGINPRGW